MWLFLVACADERGPRDPSDVVEFDGYVFSGPTDSETQLTAGEVTFTPDEGDPVEAEQPFVDDYPGYWRADLPAGQAYSLRILGDGAYPALWRGVAPEADGSWLTGALFGADTEQVDTFLASLDVPVAAESLAEGRVAHLWGYPWDAEGWSCERMTVNGVTPTCFLQDAETGLLARVDTGPISYFVALNLEPGEVRVDSGLGGSETYRVEGGDMVYAFWFVGTGTES